MSTLSDAVTHAQDALFYAEAHNNEYATEWLKRAVQGVIDGWEGNNVHIR